MKLRATYTYDRCDYSLNGSDEAIESGTFIFGHFKHHNPLGHNGWLFGFSAPSSSFFWFNLGSFYLFVPAKKIEMLKVEKKWHLNKILTIL